MSDQSVEPIPKTTPDIVEEQIEKLRELFPECIRIREGVHEIRRCNDISV